MMSFDISWKRLVYRPFHVEGFVNQHVPEAECTDGVRVFVSEAIESIPDGWRARETYRIVSGDEFTEVFELAGPGKDFEVYSEQRFKGVAPRSR